MQQVFDTEAKDYQFNKKNAEKISNTSIEEYNDLAQKKMYKAEKEWVRNTVANKTIGELRDALNNALKWFVSRMRKTVPGIDSRMSWRHGRKRLTEKQKRWISN